VAAGANRNIKIYFPRVGYSLRHVLCCGASHDYFGCLSVRGLKLKARRADSYSASLAE
jgi:hypothetical protein